MARPKKVREPIEVPEIPSIRPKPQIVDPNFGSPKPAPKPSQTKKGRKGNEESEE